MVTRVCTTTLWPPVQRKPRCKISAYRNKLFVISFSSLSTVISALSFSTHLLLIYTIVWPENSATEDSERDHRGHLELLVGLLGLDVVLLVLLGLLGHFGLLGLEVDLGVLGYSHHIAEHFLDIGRELCVVC